MKNYNKRGPKKHPHWLLERNPCDRVGATSACLREAPPWRDEGRSPYTGSLKLPHRLNGVGGELHCVNTDNVSLEGHETSSIC
jgi:hypothetical protein